MGCSKGRGLFHKPRASFRRCWVICKATPGRRCAAPRRLQSLNWDFDCKEGHTLSRRDFSLRAGHREVPTVPLPKPEAVGKALHLLIAHLAALSAAALSSECHGSAGAGQQPPATHCNPQHSPTATTWTRTRYHDFVFTASFPSQCTKAARASFWSFNSERTGRGVFTQGCVLPPFLMLFSPFLALAYKMDGGSKAG